MKAGQVLFVYSDATWQIGRVLSASGDRCELEHPDGSRAVYPAARAAWASEKRVPSAAALRAYAEEVRELVALADVAALWEAVRGRPDAELLPGALSALCLPEAGPASTDAMAWALFQDRLYFQWLPGGTVTARSPDVVAERRGKLASELREAHETNEMAAWLRAAIDAPPGSAPATPPGSSAVRALLDLALFDARTADAERARALLRRTFPGRSEPDQRLAQRTLVDLGIWRPDENLVILRSGLRRELPQEVLADAVALAGRCGGFCGPGRADLGALRAVAIDDEHTTEVDDALALDRDAVGRLVVHVLVTDVAACVPAGSPVDREALERAATVYLPEGKLPMLPEVLCEDVASLVAGAERPVIDFAMTLNDAGGVVTFKVEEAVIRLESRTTYAELDRRLREPSEQASETDAMCASLLQLADRRRDERLRNGAVIMDREEPVVVAPGGGEVHIAWYRTDDPARRLVSEWMIAACALAARWCAERRIPAVYRVQRPSDSPPGVIRRSFERHEYLNVVRTMRKAELSLGPGLHAGLGVSHYTQVTSPLRRYLDLLMHRQIKSHLRGEPAPWTAGALRALLPRIEDTLARQTLAERDSRRYWTLRWLEGRADGQWDAVVLREAGGRVLVELSGTGLQVPMKPSGVVVPGERIQVLVEVDARADRLRLRPL